MVSREELQAQAERRYPDFLRSIVTRSAFFPLELRTGKSRRATTYAERAAELAAFRTAAAALHLCVEWKTINDPRFGPHERPERAYFADETTFLGALHKAEEVQHFRENQTRIRTAFPALETWLPQNVQSVVRHHGRWPELLRVLQWFRDHPRSGLYLRQVPVEGVDTKFFEQYAAILDALLIHLHPEAVALDEKRFETRHGLAWEQPLLRLRFLDPALQAAHGFPIADLAIPAPVFRTLPLRSVNAIITENLRNYLVLPPLPETVAVYGEGDAAARLAATTWLEQARILYWGDMDLRGFAILSRLRTAYPAAQSVMMNVETLERHRAFAGKVTPHRETLPNLTQEESAALEKLGAEGLWLEQERVPYEAVLQKFTALFSAATVARKA